MRKFFKYRYLLAATIIALYYMVFNSISADSAIPDPSNTLDINVVAIPRQDILIEKQYIGYITPIQSADISSNVAGYIDNLLVSGGEEVKIGDNLVLIDQKTYQAELRAAQASTAKAQADYTNASTYYKRLKKAGKQAVSATELDTAKANYLIAQAALKQAQALEQKAKVAFDYTILQAPIDGIIGNIDLTKGNYITPNSKLFSIVQFDPIRVVFAMPDKEFIRLNSDTLAQEKIKLRLADGKLYEHYGQFRYSDNQVNKSTNSISLYADFANPQKKLLANSYVDVFISKKLKDIALIRQNYAQIKDNGIWVYLIKNNTLKQVKLQIEGLTDDFYVVSNHFADDEYLVTDKISSIPPDTKIKTNLQNIGNP